MKLLVFIPLLVLAVLLLPQQAHAHVLITDVTNSKGAVLHMSPDDDPVAGQTASLFFDVQGQDLSGVTLTIRDAAGNEVPVPLNVDGSLVTAAYVFPTQGVYNLVFTTQATGSSYTFSHSQRISRGVGSGALDKPSYPWAEMLFIASGVGFLILIIVAINRRAAISLQSKW